MSIIATIYSTRHEAHEATPAGYCQTREISSGGWVVVSPSGNTTIEVEDFVPRADSLASATLAELQQWATDMGVSSSGTKAAIIARLG